MRIKLVERVSGHKAGGEWNCPSASAAVKLIAEGKALAVEPCDLHLNPAAGVPSSNAAAPPFDPPPSRGEGVAPDGDLDGDGRFMSGVRATIEGDPSPPADAPDDPAPEHPGPKRRRKKRGA